MHIKAAYPAAHSRNPAGVVMMAAQSIDDLQARLDELNTKSAGIQAKVTAGEVELDDDLVAEIEADAAEIEQLDRKIKALKLLEPKGTGRKTSPEATAAPAAGKRASVPASPRDSARFGFANLGEMAKGAHAHARGQYDNEACRKLMAAVTTYGNEGAGTDGGFLVPPDFATQIWKKVEAEENLMARCTQLTVSGNSMSIPKDETTPWGTSGLRVYWDGEAAAMTAVKPLFENSQFRLYKLTALAPVTDELLEDAMGFESWINAKVPGLMAHAINSAIVAGTGVGKPLGILASASMVSVAKETSQPADTVWFSNINKMWSRMYAPWRRNAVWLINQDIEPSLHGMAFQATGASSMLPGTSAVPAYLPMNGLSGSPYATLMGRPVIPVQACKTVGDQGDIILVDLNQYWILRKASGMRADTSIHLYFDQAVTAFRFIFRMNGQPAWGAAITPENGSATLSWAVCLDAR